MSWTLSTDEFVCAFLSICWIHQMNCQTGFLPEFASLSGPVRAIRTIQIFKEHFQNLAILKYHKNRCAVTRNESLIYHSFKLCQAALPTFSEVFQKFFVFKHTLFRGMRLNLSHFCDLSSKLANFSKTFSDSQLKK